MLGDEAIDLGRDFYMGMALSINATPPEDLAEAEKHLTQDFNVVLRAGNGGTPSGLTENGRASAFYGYLAWSPDFASVGGTPNPARRSQASSRPPCRPSPARRFPRVRCHRPESPTAKASHSFVITDPLRDSHDKTIQTVLR